MEKWTIRPNPTARDPQRHVLLLKGSAKDITAILKKFGSSFGRPGPVTSPEGYNLSIVVHELGASERRKLEAALEEMAPAAVAAPAVEKMAPPRLERPAPVAESVERPVEQPAAPPPALAPVEIKPPPAPASPIEEEPPVAAAAPEVKPKPEPILWGLLEPADAMQTFDSLLAGPHNRFAHAASASVVSAPGSMYNPLFLYGAAGAGKTHMINAVGRSLGQALGAAEVILTSGSRLSRAASAALAQNRGGELEAALARGKALLIDDVHLLAVTEQNRALLAKAVAAFIDRGLQVVMTSIYPPRALTSLEEALNISLGKGWSVDLKVPPVPVQVQILQAYFDRHEFIISSDDAKKFHEKLGGRYFEAIRWMRRLIRFKRLTELAGKPLDNKDLLAPIFDEGNPAGALPDQGEIDAATRFALPAPSPSAKRLAILFPKGQDGMGAWAKARFFQAIGEFGIPQGYNVVLTGAYDTQEPFGVPFQIGEMCVGARAEAALILGPQEGSALAARDGEFIHAVEHILEGLSVRTAWIGHRQTTLPAFFLRAHLDLLDY